MVLQAVGDTFLVRHACFKYAARGGIKLRGKLDYGQTTHVGGEAQIMYLLNVQTLVEERVIEGLGLSLESAHAGKQSRFQ
jgi:hypothetical protein